MNLSLKELCLLKEENTPIAMSTNSFPQIVNFMNECLSCCFWYAIVLQDVVHNQRGRSIVLHKSSTEKVTACAVPTSEGQETDAIAPAPENARKKFEGRGRSRP
jgi:hypothetical protein